VCVCVCVCVCVGQSLLFSCIYPIGVSSSYFSLRKLCAGIYSDPFLPAGFLFSIPPCEGVSPKLMRFVGYCPTTTPRSIELSRSISQTIGKMKSNYYEYLSGFLLIDYCDSLLRESSRDRS